MRIQKKDHYNEEEVSGENISDKYIREGNGNKDVDSGSKGLDGTDDSRAHDSETIDTKMVDIETFSLTYERGKEKIKP